MSLVDQIKALTTRLSAEIKALKSKPRSIVVACSDESTPLTTGVKVTFRMPHAMSLTTVRATLTTASTSGAVTVDVKVSGSSPFATKPSVAASSKSGAGVLSASVIEIADDAEIVISCDAAGTGATGLKVCLIGRV